MSHRGPGMDHRHYAFSALPMRPPLAWPGGAAVAANIVIHFEHLELDPPAGSVRDGRFGDPIADLAPAYRNLSWRDYGNRIGLYRVLDLLDRLALKATIAANAMACELYPQAVEAMLARGHVFAAGGVSASRMISSRLTESEERAVIADVLDRIERATGQRPRGWIGQDQGESARTPQLLAEAGLDWVMDWPNDDQPYRMTTTPAILSMPAHSEWDDAQLLWARRLMPWRYPAIVEEALATLAGEGRTSGRYFGLHLHPWIIGKPHMFVHLETAIGRLRCIDDIWWTTADDVADCCAALPAG